jgi:hypothetical protein
MQDPQTEDFPDAKPIDKEIDYEQLHDEVRCGQYYLRVWINQASSFITQEQEQEFLRNLQLELQQRLGDSGGHAKMVILLTACLNALDTFTLKRLPFLQELIFLIQSEISSDADVPSQDSLKLLLISTLIIKKSV